MGGIAVGGTAVGAGGVAAGVHAESNTLTNINIALLVGAAVFAIYGSISHRAFSIGFLLGNGLITVAEFIPDLGRPLIERMLAGGGGNGCAESD